MASSCSIIRNDKLLDHQKEILKSCTLKLENLKRGNEDIQKSEINTTLDELNGLTYTIVFFSTEEAEKLLQMCFFHIPFTSEHLVSKLCHLLTNILIKQQVECRSEFLHACLGYFTRALQICGTWVTSDILDTLAVLVADNVGRIEQYWENLIGPQGSLLVFVSPTYPDPNICLSSLKCLQNFTLRTQDEPYPPDDWIGNCFSLLLDNLFTSRTSVDETTRCKLLILVLRGIQNVVFGLKKVPSPRVGDVLGGLKAYLFYGLPGFMTSNPTCLYPTPVSQFVPSLPCLSSQVSRANSRPANQKKRTKKKPDVRKGGKEQSQKEDDQLSEGNVSDSGYTYTSQSHGTSARSNSFYFPSWSRTSSSESDYSDSETSQVLKLRSLQAKVRQCTFSALQVIVKAVGKRTMFGFWSSFLPDSPSTAYVPQNQTVLTSILKDPSLQVRAGALAFLTELLEGSKPFLSLAEESSSPRTAFTSLSATLASVIRELHRCLLLALVAERIPFLLVQLLKCLTALVLNACYQRLSPGILSKLYRQVKPFVSHRDPQVVVASLTTLGAVFNIQPPPPEIADLLKAGEPRELTVSTGLSRSCGKNTELKTTRDTSDTTSYSQEKHPNQELLWLLSVCCDNIKGSVFSKPVPLPVRLESLQLLACLCRGYFFLLRSKVSSLEDLILFCLQEEELSIRFHGTKLLEEFGNSLLKEVNQKHSSETTSTVHEQEHTINQALHLWQQVLNSSLPRCLQSQSNNPLRCVTCDCLSNIGPKVFELLPHDHQILCLTLLLGLARDEDQNVRGAAVRCLGVYTLFPSLVEDISFLMDVGDAVIDAISDSYFIVRFKASWSLGNLTDALLISRDSCPDEQVTDDCRDSCPDKQVTDVPDTFLFSLGMAAIKACQDRDKIRANGVRALGNILNFLPASSLGKEQIKIFCSQGVASLLSSLQATIMKVRWNACYALGNALKNEDLIETYRTVTADILCSLSSCLRNCGNYKVRINATAALTIPTKRIHYDTLLPQVWLDLVSALESTQEDVDYKELDHHQAWCCQLFLSLCNLINILEPQDVCQVSQSTLAAQDYLLSLTSKVVKKGCDDKYDVLIQALKQIRNLLEVETMNDTDRDFLNNLGEAINIVLSSEERTS